MNAAATDYFASLEEAGKDGGDDEDSETDNDEYDEPPSNRSGGRRLGDGDSAPLPPTTTSQPAPSSAPPPPQKKKFATLSDLTSGPSGGGDGGGHAHDDDSDDSADPDFFAGGEKSGLAVQNPDDLKRKILDRARRTAPRPGGDEAPPPQRSRFSGTAHTLGGDDAESQVVEDPSAGAQNAQPQRPERVERRLHFWQDGFSVDDGPLYRSDDPQNAQILRLIRTGRAPLAIMNVRQDQEVDVKLEEHEGKYVQPKKKYKPFGGQGQRLGSPVPGVGEAPAPPAAAPAPASGGGSATGSEATPAKVEVDEAQPTVSLQIRLGDGTRLVSRFNTSHTLGDVYSFVNAANPSSAERNWVLMTTFPSKPLEDRTAVLGDMPELKKGGTVVQKWT